MESRPLGFAQKISPGDRDLAIFEIIRFPYTSFEAYGVWSAKYLTNWQIFLFCTKIDLTQLRSCVIDLKYAAVVVFSTYIVDLNMT